MLKQTQVAGLNLNPVTKTQVLNEIEARIKSGQKTFMTTLYSEFLYHALKDNNLKQFLNTADIAVADGIGVLWAEYFLSVQLTFKNIFLKILQAFWQVVYSGSAILLNPHKLKQTFPEKIVGADLFWDLAKLAEEKNFSIFLLGWHDQELEKVKDILEARFPKIKIVGFKNTTPDDQTVIDYINQFNPDMLWLGFGRIKQENWIKKFWSQVDSKFAIGLGGSFDYAIGKKSVPPKVVRDVGLEWLYRLFTQPHRLVRIFQATFGFVWVMIKWKLFCSFGYRANVVAVVVNKNKRVLICKRGSLHFGKLSGAKTYEDYWQFPQGGIDQGEDVLTAASRELIEETSLSDVEMLGVSNKINRYVWNQGERSFWSVFSKRYGYKGQEQNTVFFRYNGDRIWFA
ncbi:MAG: WecB/TagA/CpsF family glycosyltransferase [Candidatus Doudnabacteria bacterium]